MIHVLSFTLSRTRLQLLLFLLGFLGFLLLPSKPAFAAVVINEIFPKPDNETGEWIELYNTGPDPVSLLGYKLENSSGDKKTYIVDNSIVLPVNGFWTFDQSKTAISLYNEGDRVTLLRPKSDGWDPLDSQSYAGTLGVNNSVGRSSDGGGVWTTCASWTKNLPNNCPPPPTPAPTTPPADRPSNASVPVVLPSPTPTFTDTSIPDIVFTPIPIATFVASKSQSSTQVLGSTTKLIQHPDEKTISYADFRKYILHWTLGVVSLCIAVAAILILLILFFRRYKYRHKKPI